MKAQVVFVCEVDVEQVQELLTRVRETISVMDSTVVVKQERAQVELPAEGSWWKHKDNPSEATWRVTSSRMSRVHAEVASGLCKAHQQNGWTGPVDQFLNEFRPVKGAPEIGSRWMHRESDRLAKVQDVLKMGRPWQVRVIFLDGPEEWIGTVAMFNRSFTEATG
jgi:hypothetical protein